MNKLTYIAAAALILSGCASAKPVPLPDGTLGYVVKNCGDMAACYKKAAEVCGGKYELLQSSASQVGMINGANDYLSGASRTKFTMTIRCEKDGGSKSQ